MDSQKLSPPVLDELPPVEPVEVSPVVESSVVLEEPEALPGSVVEPVPEVVVVPGVVSVGSVGVVVSVTLESSPVEDWSLEVDPSDVSAPGSGSQAESSPMQAESPILSFQDVIACIYATGPQ